MERLAALDVWAIEVEKAVPEAIEVSESWAVELNPGVAEFEAAELAEAWALDATKQVDEVLEVAEAWDLVLNP